ncbi:NACHT, lrr and pyd domains-containing protein 5 [Plakobranchus ocellatus]|uniref:NACHT, lrr and pyd domains-containing protein 5 n=1 Tax=Plakobranchus ocellatus TaxID=259542 RepID=A0AAV4DIS8_9GAST|nr:NACHT, lrr and pyd domains-containing protein 5 [Plakobranchus ocellatus]
MSVCSLLRGVERAFCARSSSGRAHAACSQAQESCSLREFPQLQFLDSSEGHDGSGSPWKFWRRFSTRARSERTLKAEVRGRDRPEITLLESQSEAEQSPECLTDNQPRPGPLSGPLPDVVDKAPGPPRLAGPNGVPPPKPPRLFLYRTPSNVSKHSKISGAADPVSSNDVRKDGDSPTGSSVVISQPHSSPRLLHRAKTGENNNLPDQRSRNSSDGSPRTLVQPASPLYNNPNSVSFHISHAEKGSAVTKTDRDSLGEGRVKHNSGDQRHAHQPGLLTAVASQKPKIKSPELSSRRHHYGRSRRRSNDKAGGSDAKGRQRHIMVSISELLRQSLDPYPLLEPLKRAGVLTNVDMQSFLSHHDRKSVCEGLVDVVGEAGPQAINIFSDVLTNTGTCSEILEVLQVMREMDKIVHDIPHEPLPVPAPSIDGLEDDVAIPAEEKSLRYEVGYLAPDHTLKPLIELEKAQRLSKTCSSTRNSSYSLLETGSDPGSFPGLVMVSVCVAGHNLSGPRSHALADLLRERRCVCEVRVGKTRLTGQDVAVLAAALKDNSTVHSLDLRLNTIDQTGADALASLLQTTKTLRELNLSSCCLNVESLSTIAAAVGVNRSLFDLDLSFLDVGDECAPCLRDMLRANVGLRKLRLRSNNLTWSGSYVIAEGLSRNTGLQVLDLSRNSLADAGMQALAKFLPDTSLSELYVENCGVTASGCEHLGDVIARCKRLKTLDASTNLVTDAGVSRLAAALERSSSIENVGLNMCGLTNDGFSKLLDMLEKNTSVLQVKLCYNNLGETEHTNPQATSENLRYRLRIVTSSRPKLKILLWGNTIDEG